MRKVVSYWLALLMVGDVRLQTNALLKTQSTVWCRHSFLFCCSSPSRACTFPGCEMATSGPVESDAFVSGAGKAPVSKWQGFLNFLYDSKEGTVLGRTGKSWLQITIFYIIFYGVLAAFFAVLLVLFLQTLDPNEPKWQGASGIIGSTPGMGFRPVPKESGSTLIWVKQNDPNSTTEYVTGLNQFLDDYQPGSQSNAENYIDCSATNHPTAASKTTCRIKLTDLGPCSRERNYGYNEGQPCVLLKLNRIFNWVPETYNAAELPADVKAAYQRQSGKAVPANDDNQVYITCNGEDPVDQEHIGPLRLYPNSIPAYNYPYMNQRGYLSPVVMVQFLNPTPGVLINVECKAWAKNIVHSRTDRLVQVHFELLVDR